MSEVNYQEAFDELQQIVADMEEGQITVDDLTEKVARAAQLIRICKSKLTAAEHNVDEILASIDSQEIMDTPSAENDNGNPDDDRQTEETETDDEDPENAFDDDAEDEK